MCNLSVERDHIHPFHGKNRITPMHSGPRRRTEKLQQFCAENRTSSLCRWSKRMHTRSLFARDCFHAEAVRLENTSNIVRLVVGAPSGLDCFGVTLWPKQCAPHYHVTPTVSAVAHRHLAVSRPNCGPCRISAELVLTFLLSDGDFANWTERRWKKHTSILLQLVDTSVNGMQ